MPLITRLNFKNSTGFPKVSGDFLNPATTRGAGMAQSDFSIRRVAVVGAGTMGRGILMSPADADRRFTDFHPEV
jgi:hypothetical protein